ncbi:MAG: hypothetical protein IJ862_04980 [Selenomonadaceae bacterium]|nr:hypothetical protein [Selenomonadaceae bacterium]
MIDLNMCFTFLFLLVAGIVLFMSCIAFDCGIYGFWATFIIFIIQSLLIIPHIISEKIISRFLSLIHIWQALLLLIVTVQLFFLIHQPWITQKELSDLSQLEGVVEYNRQYKNNYWYLEMENGERPQLRFIFDENLRDYEGEPVIVWGESTSIYTYVYQMTSSDGEVYISIEDTNENLFRYNMIGIIWDLFFWNLLLYGMYLSVLKGSAKE